MTEIHVQRKERKLWPWVLGIVAVLLLLFVVVDRDDAGEQYGAGEVVDPMVPGTATPNAAPNSWLESQRFVLYVSDSQPDFGEMNAAHQYTRNGLRYLASALDEITRQDRATAPNIQPKIAALREGAETLREGASAPEHAGVVATVFRQATDAIAEVQRARFPDAAEAVEAVRQAAGRLSADRPLLEQRDAVKSFFDRAATAVQAMGAPESRSDTTGGTR